MAQNGSKVPSFDVKKSSFITSCVHPFTTRFEMDNFGYKLGLKSSTIDQNWDLRLSWRGPGDVWGPLWGQDAKKEPPGPPLGAIFVAPGLQNGPQEVHVGSLKQGAFSGKPWEAPLRRTQVGAILNLCPSV